MPVPTIPLWGQIISNGLNNIRNIWKTSKERYNSMSPEQKAEAARVGNQWVTDNVLPVVTTVGELIPQTSIPMAAYNTSEAVKKGNYEEAFQHVLTPVLTGSVSKGVNLGLKAGEKAIDTAGKALKNADNYITIQNALRTGKLRFGEPTTYTGIHQSKTPLTKVQFPFQRWDVTTHGADPNGFWLTLADSPNTTGTMASRPYASRWSATSQKPLIQTGEVKGLLGKKNNTRNAIVKYGRKHGADAFEFRGIRDNAIPQTDVVMVTEGTNPQYLGGVGQVKYAGPTTGKSTFIKANSQSDFVDLDAIPGYKQLRKNVAEQLGLDWKSPKVTDSPEYQQAFNNFIREWAQNTENSGKTLFGSAKGLLRGDNPLTGQPFIPDFETFVARNQARGFKENPEQLRAWYNSIIDSYPEIKIDNRFIGEMPLPYKVPKTSVKSVQMEEPIMGRGPGRALKNIGNKSGVKLIGFNFNDLPTARFKYDPITGNFKTRVPRKKWVTQAEQLVEDYFFTPEEYNRLIASGATPEQAELISSVRTANVENRYPSIFSSLGKDIYGDTANINGRARVRYNHRNNIPAALIDPQKTFNTVFHELGGHGATLNVGSGIQTIPEGQKEILMDIFKHNMELHPELRPEWKAIKDGNIELAKKLIPDVDDMYKSTKGEWNIKALQDAINYMEDVQEYSARAIGANMSNHYGIGKGWNETQLRKFFTDESVDNLMKNVWGIIPIASIGLGAKTLKEKQGGKIKSIF